MKTCIKCTNKILVNKCRQEKVSNQKWSASSSLPQSIRGINNTSSTMTTKYSQIQKISHPRVPPERLKSKSIVSSAFKCKHWIVGFKWTGFVDHMHNNQSQKWTTAFLWQVEIVTLKEFFPFQTIHIHVERCSPGKMAVCVVNKWRNEVLPYILSLFTRFLLWFPFSNWGRVTQLNGVLEP